jgi:hypothetical protein
MASDSSNGVARRVYKRTPEARARILAAVEAGAPYGSAARRGGMSHRSLNAWRAEDPEFAAEFAAAREESIITGVETIRAASKHDWRAAAWLLERRAPQHFGRREEVKHSGTLTLAQAMADVRRRRDELEGGPAALIETDADHSA